MIRYQSTSDFSEIILSCRLAFSKRSWPYLVATAIPWLVLAGQRSVRRLAIRASLKRHESSYYRFFSRFKFKPEPFFLALLTQIVQAFGLKKLLIATDDTLCPKWGKAIFGAASFFDHVRRPRPGFIWGHNWVVLAVVVHLFGTPVALPFWVALYRPKKGCKDGEFRTRLQIVAEVLARVRKLFPRMKIDLVADGAYNNSSMLKPILTPSCAATPPSAAGRASEAATPATANGSRLSKRSPARARAGDRRGSTSTESTSPSRSSPSRLGGPKRESSSGSSSPETPKERGSPATSPPRI